MPSQSRSEGTYMAGKVTVIDTDDVTPEVRALLADRDRWRKRAQAMRKQAHKWRRRIHGLSWWNGICLSQHRAESATLCEQLAEARGAMQADAERLLAATQRVGMPPAGCDTADWLAEEVLTLRGKLAEAQSIISTECPIGSLDIVTSLRVEKQHLRRHRDELAAAEARAQHWQDEHAILKAANQLDLEHALAESARAERLAGALRDLTLDHEFWDRHITAPEDAVVDVLCQYWGYGAVMDAASRLWAKVDPDGSFVVGACRGFARRALKALATSDTGGKT